MITRYFKTKLRFHTRHHEKAW